MWCRLAVFACVCALAHDALGQSTFGKLDNRGQSRYTQNVNQAGTYQQGQSQQYQYQPSQNQQGQYHQAQNQYQPAQNQYQPAQNQYQPAQNQYQQNQYHQSQASVPKSQNLGSCREQNERYPVSGSCDKYVECLNGTAEEKLCPDGLLFNPNLNFNQYPCQYPNEYQCLERSSLQPAQATDLCPHQFAHLKLGDARNCSAFRSCVNGVAYDFTCPEGLAYSSASYRCEWPDEVEDCDAEAFLGFRCPEVPQSKELGAPAGFRFYRSDTNCQKYFLCIEGRPRLLQCGGDSAFDELTSGCVSADQVASCPAELRALAVRRREEEQQRQAREDSIIFKTPNQRSRF